MIRPVAVVVTASLLGFSISAKAAEEAVFRSGDEVIVKVKQLDQLRQTHKKLSASLRVIGVAAERRLTVNLADRLTENAIVIDVAGFGHCRGVSIEVKDGDGNRIFSQQVAPVPVVTVRTGFPARQGGTFAAIEPGSKLNPAETPQIALPDLSQLREVILATPQRSIMTGAITFPVVTDSDLPGLASENYVVVSRQSVAPDDPSKCSLYFSYRKAIFDSKTTQLKKWRKMLVEVPLQRKWLDESGDSIVNLPLGGFAIHTTEELERFGKRWNAPQGYPMLGETSTGLAQGGQCVDTDDEGRMYITNVHDGAGVVRFNPHTGKFEQPPVNFPDECRKFLPPEDDWRRNWDAELVHVVCTRGRVYIVFARNYRVNTPNGRFEYCSGVVSIPQDNWHDTEAFRKDIRLHAGCWAGAEHRLYQENVAIGGTRNLGTPSATTQGIAFGSWRLDLDERGNTHRLAVVGKLSDLTAADGAALPPATVTRVQGLSKQQAINVGSAGRQFLQFAYGEFKIPKAALALTLPGDPQRQLADSAGRYLATFPGAPVGSLTVRFDIAAKIKSEPARYGEVANALSGISQGPNYSVTAIPGEPGQALGVCEYSYYLSKLDFSRCQRDGRVYKSYLPMSSSGEKTGLPLQVGLGPYIAEWFEHDDALWLYLGGYTGMTRIMYSKAGKPLDAFASDVFHTRLSPKPVDGVARDNVKDFLHFLPALNGNLINIGRGRFARGGGVHSAGLELFDPRALGLSQTAVVMNRCFGLHSPVSRVVYSGKDLTPRQEIYVASGNARPEYVQDISDPARRPKNLDPKVFVYRVDATGALQDLYGFSLPILPKGSDGSGDIILSPCGQFLVLMQAGGTVLSYHIVERRFVDGVQLRTSAGPLIQPLESIRPASTLWRAPNGQAFFLTSLQGAASESVEFFQVHVSNLGHITFTPHLVVTGQGQTRMKEFNRVVHCFLPDLVRKDGSYDLILGGSQDNGGQPTVRVIEDFIRASGLNGT